MCNNNNDNCDITYILFYGLLPLRFSIIACFHMTSRHCVGMARNANWGQEVIWYLESTITNSKRMCCHLVT